MSQSMGYERGWHLRGSPLWFDAERRRELCLLTGADTRPPPLHRRVIASATLAQALGRLGYAAPVLPTPWKRPMGIGGARIQLFDARGRAGAAVARVETDAATHLMAGLLRMAPLSTPGASHLVARLPAAAHRGLPLRDVAIGLATAIANLRPGSGTVRVWVDHPEVGLAVMEEMAVLKHPLRPRGALAKWAEVPRFAGPDTSVGTVALAPHLDAGRLGAKSVPTDVHMLIDSGIGGAPVVLPGQGISAPLSATFPVAWFADAAALAAAARHTRAASILLADVPAAAESKVRQAVAAGVDIKFLSDARQLPLAQ